MVSPVADEIREVMPADVWEESAVTYVTFAVDRSEGAATAVFVVDTMTSTVIAGRLVPGDQQISELETEVRR